MVFQPFTATGPIARASTIPVEHSAPLASRDPKPPVLVLIDGVHSPSVPCLPTSGEVDPVHNHSLS
ncbi:hypothetical protein LY76DRAFT_596408 [Colletotrichum caudatum]|nr:hypothetical protein LY76DRAFT_596408 [Colletotrichum caudatum]